MSKSIKVNVGFRVVAALLSILLFSVMTTVNTIRIDRCRNASSQTNALLGTTQTAELAHYKWAANLSSALYEGTEFTGSKDPTACVLGKWIYGEAGTADKTVLDLRDELEPLHKELHGSAELVLNMYGSDPDAAQEYYRTDIEGSLATLVEMLDQVIARGETLRAESETETANTIIIMHVTTGVCLILALVCLLSLIFYVVKRVVEPIITLTKSASVLQNGEFSLDMEYKSDDEVGILVSTIKNSLSRIRGYVADINKIMGELSGGNFDVRTFTDYVGDFRSIQVSMMNFTESMSYTLKKIIGAEKKISANAEQLSGNSQSLAEGATEQASATEQLYASLDELYKSAQDNVKTADNALEHARLTGDQVSRSSDQMQQMMEAMSDVNSSSQQIGQIISTIEDIAFQTNILALNAAIEAARAGAAGKGFAVVADEVRGLAEQSDEASKATKALIENCVNASKRGIKLVKGVSESLSDTMKLVTRSNDDIGVIADAIRNEAEAITQINQGIGQIAAVTQTNSASSEEAAAVSAELFAQAKLMQEQTKDFKLMK